MKSVEETGFRRRVMTCLTRLLLARRRDPANGTRHAHDAVLGDDVAAAVLCGVEGGIRRLDQITGTLARIGPRAGDADADGHALVA